MSFPNHNPNPNLTTLMLARVLVLLFMELAAVLFIALEGGTADEERGRGGDRGEEGLDLTALLPLMMLSSLLLR
jgi:hypothetical protein